MKKLQLIIICLIYSLNTLGQANEVMQLTLPKGTKKLNEQQLKNLSHRGFDDNMASSFHDHIYKKDRLLIYYLNLIEFPDHPEHRHSLESNQTMTVALLSGKSELKGNVSIVDNSKIFAVNNIDKAFTIYELWSISSPATRSA